MPSIDVRRIKRSFSYTPAWVKTQNPAYRGQISTKLALFRLMLDRRGKDGKFLLRWEQDAVGAGSRRLESRMGQGRAGEVKGWEVEGKWRVGKGIIDWKVGWSGVRK